MRMVSVRNPQFRYSLLVAKKTTFSISVEKPTSDVLSRPRSSMQSQTALLLTAL